MSSDADALSEAVTSPSDAAGVSEPLQIVPEKFAEHAEELGEAMIQLAAPAAPNEAAAVFGQRLEKVAHSLGRVCNDANSSAQSLQQAADEGFRRHFELGMHFIEDLVLARTPSEILELQLSFFTAQFELFAEQAREMQRQFARTYLAPFAKSGVSETDGFKTL
jgi:hypothetical protein